MGKENNFKFDPVIENELSRVINILVERDYSKEQLIVFAATYVLIQNNSEKCYKEILQLIDEKDNLKSKFDIELNDYHLDIVSNLKELAKTNMELGLLTGQKSGFELGKKVQSTSLARQGGNAKKTKYDPLKELAKEIVNKKSWQSRRNAAMTIAPKILEESKNLNIPLSEAQAVVTITGWLKGMGLPANISS